MAHADGDGQQQPEGPVGEVRGWVGHGGPELADAPRQRRDRAGVGRQGRGLEHTDGGKPVAQPEEPGLQESPWGFDVPQGFPGPECGGLPLWPPGPAYVESWLGVLGGRPDLAPALPDLRGMADGPTRELVRSLMEDRPGRLRGLGNAVVPMAAAFAFIWLWDAIALHRLAGVIPK